MQFKTASMRQSKVNSLSIPNVDTEDVGKWELWCILVMSICHRETFALDPQKFIQKYLLQHSFKSEKQVNIEIMHQKRVER